MAHEVGVILVVEKGSEAGKTFQIESDRIILGRGQSEEDKLCFDNPFVSRTHAEIRYDDGCFWLRDLGSRNGTQLNGQVLDKMTDYRLNSNDIIELAGGAVLLRFCISESTIELHGEELGKRAASLPVRVDEQARDVWVDGIKLDPPLPFRDFELLLILYRNMGKACSKDDLARSWGEEFPADEQIEQSIHRIRKRVEPDPSNPSRIITVRGYGYKFVLDTQV